MELTGSSFGGWRQQRSFQGVYTGGKIDQSSDGKLFVCMFNDDVIGVDSSDFTVQYSLHAANADLSEEKFVMFALHQESGTKLVTAGENQLLRSWQLTVVEPEAEESDAGKSGRVYHVALKRSWKAHSAPVTSMDIHPSGELVVSGSSDLTVKIWNVDAGFCTHNFRGHSGVVSSVKFHPRQDALKVTSTDISGKVRVWGLTKEVKSVEFTDHMSAVTCIEYVAKGAILLTTGRDKVVNFWDLAKNKLIKTYPVYEALESTAVVKDSRGGCVVALAGENGGVRLLDCTFASSKADGFSVECKVIAQQQVAQEDGQGPLTDVLYCADQDSLIAVNWEQLILFLNSNTLATERRVIGHLDEVTDLQMLPRVGAGGDSDSKNTNNTVGSQVVLSTNSNEAHILNMKTLDSHSLRGHSKIVFGVAVSGDGRFIATASKDCTVRVFSAKTFDCVLVCSGHTEAVSSVCFSSTYATSKPQLVSCSADKTIKTWSGVDGGMYTGVHDSSTSRKSKRTRASSQSGDASSDAACVVAEGTVDNTVLAHDKSINMAAIAPNGKFIATASQDKTVKLWEADTLKLKGILRGHKRGVWDVKFSPTDMILASSSADKTIRIWSFTDLSCLSTLEGHASSVLRLQFVRNGTQVMSSGSDGVMKLWSVKTSECVSTGEEFHEDRVWGLTTSRDGQVLVSGSGDGLLVWEDKQELEQEIVAAKREEELLAEQNLIMEMRKGNNAHAALLALRLDKPFTLHNLLRDMITTKENPEHAKPNELEDFVASLEAPDVLKIWEFIKEWNTINKSTRVAQTVLARLLGRTYTKETLKVTTHVEALQAYSKRHVDRIDGLVQQTFLFDHCLQCIDGMKQ